MSNQIVNSKTKPNIKSFEEMTVKEVDAASQISNLHKESAASEGEPIDKVQDIGEQEGETTFQRRPQFRLNENNRRRF